MKTSKENSRTMSIVERLNEELDNCIIERKSIMKKKILISLFIIVLSLAFTFILFEQLSWYHFGDIPTSVVLYRLIAFFPILTITVLGSYSVIIRNIKKKS